MKSPWRFHRYGETGRWVSDLFPHMAQHVDDMCFVQGMHTEGVAHGPATLFLHTGSTNMVRPAIGSWTTYGLGTTNENLPGFMTICPSLGNGGPRNWSNAFLPGSLSGHGHRPIRHADGARPSSATSPTGAVSPAEQRGQLELLQALNAEQNAAQAGRRRTGGGHRLLRPGLSHADARSRASSTWPAKRPRRTGSTASASRRRTISAGNA